MSIPPMLALSSAESVTLKNSCKDKTNDTANWPSIPRIFHSRLKLWYISLKQPWYFILPWIASDILSYEIDRRGVLLSHFLIYLLNIKL